MRKLLISTYKEFLLLSRDIGGLVILFVMPLLLIITVTLIQESSFKTVQKTKIPIVIVDKDKDELSKKIISELNKSNTFNIITQKNNVPYNEEKVKTAIRKGEYQLAVIIPEKMTVDLYKKIDQNVAKVMEDFGVEDEDRNTNLEYLKPKEVKLYFDPASQISFKDAVLNNIDKMISKIETQAIYKAFQEELSEGETTENPMMSEKSFITFKEINPKNESKELVPNSTQHNVPAWTLFAIFFIVIPLSINMVKEKNLGTFVRLRTNPVSYTTILGGKIITYLSVCFVQYILMLLVGVYILPLLELNALEVTMKGFLLSSIVAIFSGLAAIGFGVLLGTIAKTQEQSAPFGATAVVLLAAIGGIWVPEFIMPKIMQIVSKFSPMNWGLNAFYDVFLREGSLFDILPEISLLFLFFVITNLTAIIYDRNKRAV